MKALSLFFCFEHKILVALTKLKRRKSMVAEDTYIGEIELVMSERGKEAARVYPAALYLHYYNISIYIVFTCLSIWEGLRNE